MKKLMRKLVLSSFALGLAVVTLTTTTFAWYTSNVEVKANNISGASASAGSALLMISNDNAAIADKKWSTTIDVTKYNTVPTDATVAATPNQLTPVKYASSDSTLSGITLTTLTDVVSSGYIQFDLYFKMASGAGETRYLWLTGLTLSNQQALTSTLPTKDVLAVNNAYQDINPSWTASGETQYPSTYNVDIRRALLISAVSTSYTNNGTTASTKSRKVFDPESLNSYSDSLTGVTGFNAHAFYNHVMCSETTHSTTEQSNPKCKCIVVTEQKYEAVSLGTAADFAEQYLVELPAANLETNKNNYAKVTFTIFLNGWDLACFDACQGQNILASMTFGVGTTNTGAFTPATA